MTIQLHSPCTPASFFSNTTATTAIYTLSLHDALPICQVLRAACYRTRMATAFPTPSRVQATRKAGRTTPPAIGQRSEEHTSELQSLRHLVCRLLLEKKKHEKQ